MMAPVSESPAPPLTPPPHEPLPHEHAPARPEGERLRLTSFPVSLAITVLVAIFYMVARLLGGPDDESLFRLGWARRDLILEDRQVFRLVCAAFLHGGLFHIVMNGLALIQLAPLVEHLWGSSRLVVVYVLSALGGTIASAIFQPMPSVGASGAILGLAGLLLGATWFAHEPLRSRLREVLGRRLFMAVLLTFVVGLSLQFGGAGVIDNMGHLGGVVAGLLCSLVYRDPAAEPSRATHALAAVLTAVCVAAFAWMAFWPSRASIESQVQWQTSMQRWSPDHPRAEDVTLQVAQSLLLNGDHDRARAVLLERLDAVPDSRATLSRLARSLTVHGDVSPELRARLARLAERALERAGPDPLTGDPALERAELLDGVADLQAAAGDIAAATRTEERAIALLEGQLRADPTDPKTLNDLAWLLVTRADPARSEPARAHPLAWAAVNRLEQSPWGFLDGGRVQLVNALDTLGEVLRQQGKLDDAAGFQRRALELARDVMLSEDLERRLQVIETERAERRRGPE